MPEPMASRTATETMGVLLPEKELKQKWNKIYNSTSNGIQEAYTPNNNLNNSKKFPTPAVLGPPTTDLCCTQQSMCECVPCVRACYVCVPSVSEDPLLQKMESLVWI